MEFLIFLVFWLIFGVVGGMIMSGKGRSSCGGFALGVLLGPIGLIIALLVRPSAHHEAERQLEIEALKGGGSAPSKLPNEQPREMPRRRPSKQPQEQPGETRDESPGGSTKEQPSAAPTPNVYLRERPLRTGSAHYRWECDSCGEMGDWTANEARAESQAEAHVCARRIPRRR